MRMIKRIILVLLTFILVGCQSRFGSIEVLDNLKISDISGIYVKANDSFLSHGYLTENDETSVIKELKKIKVNELEKTDNTVMDFNYCITIETNDKSYELLVLNPNNLSIDRKFYKTSEVVIDKIYDILSKVSYFKKS